MNSADVIRSDAEFLGGTPVFVGTRVPEQTLFDHLEAGESIDDFLEGFPSEKRDQVISMLGVWRQKIGYLVRSEGIPCKSPRL